MNNIIFIFFVLIAGCFLFYDIKKGKIPVKASFWWTIIFFVMLILAIFPGIIDAIAAVFGVYYPPTILFLLCILFLLFMNYRTNKKIEELDSKIIKIEQQLAIEKKDHEKQKKH